MAAYSLAFLEVNVITDPAVSQGNLPFQRDFATAMQMINYGKNNRQTPEDTDYWSVHLIGIYEYGNFTYGNPAENFATIDNDANNEAAFMGWTNMGQEPESSFIAEEVFQDVADQWNWSAQERTHVRQLLAVHETGHQFQLTHPADNPQIYPGHVMTHPEDDPDEAQIPQMQLQFKEEDIKKIREKISKP